MKKRLKHNAVCFNHDTTRFKAWRASEFSFFSTPPLLTTKPLKKKYTFFSKLKWRLASLTRYYLPTEVPIDPRGPTGFYNLEDIEMEPTDAEGNPVGVAPYSIRGLPALPDFDPIEDKALSGSGHLVGPDGQLLGGSPEDLVRYDGKIRRAAVSDDALAKMAEFLWPVVQLPSTLNISLHRATSWRNRNAVFNRGRLGFRTLVRLAYRTRRFSALFFERRVSSRFYQSRHASFFKHKTLKRAKVNRRGLFRRLTGHVYNLKYLNWLCHDAYVIRFPVNHKRRAERNYEKALRDTTFIRRFHFWTEELQNEVRPWLKPSAYTPPTGDWLHPVLAHTSERLRFLRDPLFRLTVDLHYRLHSSQMFHIVRRAYFFNNFWLTWRGWKWGNLWRNYVAVRQFNLGNFTGVRNNLIRTFMPRDRRYFARRNFFFHYWRYLWKIRRHYKFRNTVRRSVGKFYDFKFQRFVNVYLLSLEAVLVRVLNIKNILYARALLRAGHVLVNGKAAYNGRLLLGRFDLVHFSAKAGRWLNLINRRSRNRLRRGGVVRRRRDPKAFFYGRASLFTVVINPRRLQSRTYFKGQFSSGVPKRSLRYLYNMIRR